MGATLGVLPGIVKALSCQDCARYVCNAMDIKSSCCQCWSCELETSEVAIAEDNSEISVDVEGCFEAHSR